MIRLVWLFELNKFYYRVSLPFRINQNLIEDTISYFVIGEELIAKELILKLNVFYGGDLKLTRLIFEQFASQLYYLALDVPIHSKLSLAIDNGGKYNEIADNTEVSLRKIKWENSKTNGYGLEFRIKQLSQQNQN